MVIGAMFLTSACSAFLPKTQTTDVTCSPEGAVVVVNGQRYKSPAQFEAKRNRDLSIQCRKEGYETAQRTVGHHFNATGVLDVVGTVLYLLPGIGLLTPGAYSLDETNVNIELFEK
jgi:hypothetical protein